MKRNAFGQPRPGTAEEIEAAFEETRADPSECNAEIEEVENDGFGNAGFSAEVRNNEDGASPFSTCAFTSRDELVAALTAAGIAEDDITDL